MSRAERCLLVLVAATVAFAPVFLGGIGRFERDTGAEAPGPLERFLWAHGPWAILSGLAAAIAAAAVAVAAGRRAAGEPEAWRIHGALLLPLGGMAALAILHLVPLPPALERILSPRGAAAREIVLPGDEAWRPLSRSPAGTADFLAGLGMGGAVLLGTLLAARRRGAAIALAAVIAGTAAAAGIYGAAEVLAGSPTVLGFPKAEGGGLSGPFINRSQMAALAAMGIPVAAGLGVLLLGRDGEGRRRSIAGGLLALAAAAALLGVIPMTHARMGLLSAAAGIGAAVLLAARRVRWPAWATAAAALLLLAGIGFGAVTAARKIPALEERFRFGRTEKGGFFDVRFPAWKSTVALAARYPLLGTGPGTYETAIHETQSPLNPDELIHAHSEPLQALAEGGVVGLALAILLAAAAAGAAWRGAASGDPVVRWIACGCGGAVAALLTGCLTEFHLHVPGVALAGAVAAALPAALLAGEPPPPPRALPGRLVAILAGAAVLLAGGALAATGPAAARGAARRAEQAGDVAAWREAAAAAVAADPRSAPARRSRAFALLAGGSGDPGFPARAAEALVHAEAAVDRDPYHAHSHWARASALLALDRTEEAVPAIAAARSRAGGIGHLHFAAGKVLLLLSLQDASLRAPALDALRAAGEVEPRWFTDSVSLLQALGMPLPGNEALVPDRDFAWNNWAHWLASAGEHEAAFAAVVRLWTLFPTPETRAGVLAYGARAGKEAEARAILAEPPGGR